MASGTLMPAPFYQALDDAGVPLSGAKLYFFDSGTSTPATVYTDANLQVAHATPVECDSAGRAVIYLGPSSYKLQVKTSAGVLVREVDPVTATAPYNVDLDILGVAGTALAAGEVVYLSGGDGGTTAGRWYKTDADVELKSSLASMVGMIPRAISSAALGTIRLSGKLEGLAGLVAGTPYYVSQTAGALTSTPPTNARLVGVADSGTTLVLFGGNGGGITVTSGLSFVPLEAYGSDQAAVIATINASTEVGGTLRITANKIHISGSTTFASGYDPTAKLNADGSNPAVGFLAAIGAADDAATTLALAEKLAASDLEAAIGTDVTTIDGGKIATNTLAANRILAGTITGWTIATNTLTGNTITGGTITGSTIRTSSGNGRVQMTESPNEFAWFDSAGVRCGTIDADGIQLEAATSGSDTPRKFLVGTLGKFYSLSTTQLRLESTASLEVNATTAVRVSSDNNAIQIVAKDSSITKGLLTLSGGADGGAAYSGSLECALASIFPTWVGSTLGTAAKKWGNIHLDLASNAAPTYVVVNKSGDATALGYLAGHTGDVTISGTTLTFKAGVLTAVA